MPYAKLRAKPAVTKRTALSGATDFFCPSLASLMMPNTPLPGNDLEGQPSEKRHILTIALEDYFQVGAFNRFVQKNQWYRFETRLEQNTVQTLTMLDQHQAKATFFVLGWVAKRFPELVRMVSDAGHEVGIKGYYHRSVREMTPEEFRLDTLRARDIVEQATGRAVVGYRVADGWFTPEDFWAMDELAEMGFAYDSSMAPMGQHFTDQPFRSHIHYHEYRGRTICEVPISTAHILGRRMPIAGGNYLRQFPQFLTHRAMAKWHANEPSPMVAYFHVWELDPEQPRLAIGSWFTQKRHYRNLHKMHERLTAVLKTYQFTSVANFLQIPDLEAPENPEAASIDWKQNTLQPDGSLHGTPPPMRSLASTPLTVIVPMYNERETVHFLSNTLGHVRKELENDYEVRFLLVDDGSTDGTWEALQTRFDGKAGYRITQHDRNYGVSAAIMTGIKKADTELVASMDCDCSYDPLELRNMLPLLQPGVDMVTASPYHPEGAVKNVPAWRLTLSKGAAWLYRRVLHHKLSTYTSCFRVYRRSSVAGFQLTHQRYLGIAELLGRIDLTGGTIVEHPATLEVRVLGRSKMKTFRTIVGHLGLLLKLMKARITGQWTRAHRDSVIKEVITSHKEHSNVLIRKHPALVPVNPNQADVRRMVINPPR
jgi:polysaccharide deacetylase family protein (PEP-CTERM system associated)